MTEHPARNSLLMDHVNELLTKGHRSPKSKTGKVVRLFWFFLGGGGDDNSPLERFHHS